MRAPDFWWRERPTPAARLLAPLGLVYGAVSGHRMAGAGLRAALPVICVGNVVVGGAGKTPTALALAAMLREMGERPAFLSRGYGGRLAGPVAVDPARHGPDDVGDEPLLLAASAPTIVARDRPAGATLAASLGASVVVMDDGLQNPSLAKDLSVAVVDGATGLGNGLVLPAGPLRAPMSRQWPRIDAVILVGEGAPGAALGADATRRGLPVLTARLVPDEAAAIALRGRRVLAFAGIGRPEKFFATLDALGAVVMERCAFPDHHRFAPREIRELGERARRDGLVLVTTAKDRARIAAPLTTAITVLPATLAFAEPDAVRVLLGRVLARRSAMSRASPPPCGEG